jgi:hypothetical protein
MESLNQMIDNAAAEAVQRVVTRDYDAPEEFLASAGLTREQALAAMLDAIEASL